MNIAKWQTRNWQHQEVSCSFKLALNGAGYAPCPRTICTHSVSFVVRAAEWQSFVRQVYHFQLKLKVPNGRLWVLHQSGGKVALIAIWISQVLALHGTALYAMAQRACEPSKRCTHLPLFAFPLAHGHWAPWHRESLLDEQSEVHSAVQSCECVQMLAPACLFSAGAQSWSTRAAIPAGSLL